ncbi:MAG: tRNA (guanosine(37)-N1)-methyltransferase TrmD [bacterium]
MRIDVVTAFPEMIQSIFNESMLLKAQEKGIVVLKVWDLRIFTNDKRKSIDDYPYGGGAGMILKPEPLFRAVDKISEEVAADQEEVILMSPQGRLFNQREAEVLSKKENLIFLCGHYRGVDERVVENLATQEISIGDYVLTGGELPAAVVIDSVVRLIPGVLGDFDSAEGDSLTRGELDYPHYTRPPDYRGMKVPDVLLSGHHKKVEEWRKKQAKKRTKKKRPDLFKKNNNL